MMLKVKVLMYHSIQKPPKGASFKSLFVKTGEFKRQIQFLKISGYNISTIDNLTEKTAILTFDDAYKNFIENALPVIEKQNITAYVFVPAKYVGEYNKWDIDKVKAKLPLMDWKDLEYIVKKGIKIGSHTLSHPFLTKISVEEAKKEVEYSKHLIEDKLGIEVDTFCYPYGDYNSKIVEIVKKAGYRYAFTTKEGKFNGFEKPFEIRRIFVEGNKLISLPDFIRKVVVY